MVRERCEEIGRDPATLETSMMVTRDRRRESDPRQAAEAVGSAEQIADQVKTKVLGAGIDGVIINLPTERHGYRPGDITALGEAETARQPLVPRRRRGISHRALGSIAATVVSI